MNLVLKIAAGIILATAIMALGSFGVTIGMAYWADKQLQEQIAEQEERERLVLIQQRKEAERKRQAELQAQALRQEQASRAAAQNQIDNAFEDQYVPPPECRSPQSDAQWVKCVDLKRTAKSEFRTHYILLESEHQDIKIGIED